MLISKTASKLLTLVSSIVTKRIEVQNEVFELVIEKFEEFMSEIHLLALDAQCIDEASFAAAVYVDEMMYSLNNNWSLLQLRLYKTNCGGEEFFDKLHDCVQTYRTKPTKDRLDLIEFYCELISLGFKGRHWMNGMKDLETIRQELTELLGIKDDVVLCNSAALRKGDNDFSLLQRQSLIFIIFMLLSVLAIALVYSDISQEHAEYWETFTKKILSL